MDTLSKTRALVYALGLAGSLLAMSACAVTPDNCARATDAVFAATSAKAMADAVAAANPQSSKMQQAAILAGISLDTALAMQATVCPNGE